tara:strand:- start:2412 stop:2705 length:294 start_codon:yes stop_codon:yes gene_type:complete
MILGLLLLISSSFGADIIVKNKTTIEGDFDLSITPYISDEISVRISSGVIEKNQVLIGVKYRVNDKFSTSLNLFLQNQRKHGWKLDYGPLVKMNIIF